MADTKPTDAPLGMTVQEAVAQLSRLQPAPGRGAPCLAVQVYSPGGVGPLPKVALLGLTCGIDWDAGSVIFTPAQALTTLSIEDVAAIRKSVSQGQSWHAYKSWEKQQNRICELEAEISKLKQQLGSA